MIIDLLSGILLLLGIAWATLGIAYLWRLFKDSTARWGRHSPKQGDNGQGEGPKPSVSQGQVDNARHILVGRSKPFISPSVPDVPDISSSENPTENPGTFAGEKPQVPEEKEAGKDTEEDNEMLVDYTMDEPDEDSIAREELQIADESMPEVSPSAILARELVRVTGWHGNDSTLDEESEAEVQDTLQSIRGTRLMDYIKETTLQQEKDHQKLLAAIRKAEEAEMTGEGTSSPDADSEHDGNETSGETRHPLSYYL